MPDDVRDDAPLEKFVVRVPDEEGLSLLPTLTPGDGMRTSTDEVSERLAELDGTFDVEILVGAPVLASPEAFELCPLVDGTIVVFDVARHGRSELEKCVDALASTGTPVLGVVAVSVPSNW
jgi:Mrp family chromosome partitioning ATPase